MLNLKSKESSFLKLIDVIPDAIIIVDSTGKIKHTNSKTEEVFGYKAEELIGNEIEILLPSRLRHKHIKHREGYSSNKPLSRPMGSGLNLLARRKDGTEFSVDIMLSPIETDEGKLIMSVVRDITILKQREDEIKRKSKQLEDLVSTLTHDLKTPLLGAEISFKHLIEGYFGKLTEQQKEIINLLIQGNNGTLRLVNNLLSVFKYESESYRLLLEEIDISELLEKAVNAIKPLLNGKDISVKISKINFKFTGDAFELERVIINLLSNSIKFTNDKGVIELRGIKNENGNVIISIEDHGKGMSKDEVSSLFERFWQSAKSVASYNSTGLGLYLCKQIVEAHGGKIWVESEPGKGTTISFEIPELTHLR